MAVTVAAFADPTLFADRSSRPIRDIGAKLGRHFLLGTAALATIGVAAVTVIVPAAWLLSSTLSVRHADPARARLGPRDIALVPSYPGAAPPKRLADIVVFPVSLADVAKPVRLAEQTPLHVIAPPPRRPNGVPIPRVAPPELASLRTIQQLAALPPAPAPAPLAVTPPRKAAARTPDVHTAVYDISARSVYLPNGKTLEAHSGLGDLRDDPRYTGVKRRGPTPPNTYDLSLRERLFHGVRAIRLTPVSDDKMFGRDGMLAHTYMLGPDGDSNGCVSFKDYQAFLQAYLKGDIDRLVVVPGNGAVLAARNSTGREARYASSEPGPSSQQFSAAQ